MLRTIKKWIGFSSINDVINVNKHRLKYVLYFNGDDKLIATIKDREPKEYDIAVVNSTSLRETHYRNRKLENGSTRWEEILSGETTWSEDLVLYFYNDKSLNLSLQECIRLASKLCEKCLNVAIHNYDKKRGYSIYSQEALDCNTSCDFCKKDIKGFSNE